MQCIALPWDMFTQAAMLAVRHCLLVCGLICIMLNLLCLSQQPQAQGTGKANIAEDIESLQEVSASLAERLRKLEWEHRQLELEQRRKRPKAAAEAATLSQKQSHEAALLSNSLGQQAPHQQGGALGSPNQEWLSVKRRRQSFTPSAAAVTSAKLNSQTLPLILHLGGQNMHIESVLASAQRPAWHSDEVSVDITEMWSHSGTFFL